MMLVDFERKFGRVSNIEEWQRKREKNTIPKWKNVTEFTYKFISKQNVTPGFVLISVCIFFFVFDWLRSKAMTQLI